MKILFLVITALVLCGCEVRIESKPSKLEESPNSKSEARTYEQSMFNFLHTWDDLRLGKENKVFTESEWKEQVLPLIHCGKTILHLGDEGEATRETVKDLLESVNQKLYPFRVRSLSKPIVEN
jgi:hypothetical protein